jgi:hypothetical protein
MGFNVRDQTLIKGFLFFQIIEKNGNTVHLDVSYIQTIKKTCDFFGRDFVYYSHLI